MGVTFFTSPFVPSFPPLSEWRPTPLVETASMLAIQFASDRLTRVLLLTGSEPKLVQHSSIRWKPGAIQTVGDCGNWTQTLHTVKEFCQRVSEPRTPFARAQSCFRPVVIVNDADHFIARGGVGGQFSRSCEPTHLARIDTLARPLDEAGGELVVMAVLEKSDATRWSRVVEVRGWQWRQHDEVVRRFVAPANASKGKRASVSAISLRRKRQVPEWCHRPDEDPPATFRFGPLMGTLKRLASWLYPDGKEDRRRVFMKTRDEVIWVRMLHTRFYEVWFQNQRDYATANGRRLADS